MMEPKIVYMEPFKVVGILKARRMVGKKIQAVTLRNINRCVLIPLSATPLSGEGKPAGEGLDEVIVAFGSSPQVRKGASAVAHIMQARHDQVKDFDLVVPVELLAQAQRTQKVFNVVLGGIAAISLLVGGIGIMNMMLVTVSVDDNLYDALNKITQKDFSILPVVSPGDSSRLVGVLSRRDIIGAYNKAVVKKSLFGE